ncbi:MAG: hypothetical protein RIQ88_734 [Actinomycetota bacterium]
MTAKQEWQLLAHPEFLAAQLRYYEDFKSAASKFGEDARKTTPAKKLKYLIALTRDIIPENPANQAFLLGDTLGENYRHWRRAKFLQQYRIFFRYSSNISTIIYGWVNDSETLRAYGSKTDAYVVFRKMLESGRMPNSWEELMQEAKRIS